MSTFLKPAPYLRMTTQEAIAQGAVMFGELPIGAQFTQLDERPCECGQPKVWVKDTDRSCYTDHWIPLAGLEHSWDGDVWAATLVIPLTS